MAELVPTFVAGYRAELVYPHESVNNKTTKDWGQTPEPVVSRGRDGRGNEHRDLGFVRIAVTASRQNTRLMSGA
jgi:hypothetical protein